MAIGIHHVHVKTRDPKQTLQFYVENLGAVLIADGKFQEAIAHLEEDSNGPASMLLLWQAYGKTGASDQAKNLAARLANVNLPTVEQALVVPPFRSALANQAGQP